MAKQKLAADSRDVVQELIEVIRAEGLTVGDRLPSIRQFADRLGVSTNLVRDAMVQAQAMGLVRLEPRSGVFLQSLNYAPLVDALSNTLPTMLIQRDHNLLYLLDARRIVELEAVALAAQQRRIEDLLPVREALKAMLDTACDDRREEFVEADIQFHLGLVRASGNPVLAIIVQALLGVLRPHILSLPWTAERRLKTQHCHEEIYDAVLSGSSDRAKAAMQEHLGHARETLFRDLHTPLRTG